MQITWLEFGSVIGLGCRKDLNDTKVPKMS